MATAHEWQQHIQTWQASGLTQAAYCRQHGLNPTTFSGWQRRYRAEPASATGLLPIQVASLSPTPASQCC
jgi:transposase